MYRCRDTYIYILHGMGYSGKGCGNVAGWGGRGGKYGGGEFGKKWSHCHRAKLFRVGHKTFSITPASISCFFSFLIFFRL